MLINGENHIPMQRVMDLLGIETEQSLHISPWKQRLSEGYLYRGYYSQRVVYKVMKDLEIRDMFHCKVQSLVMLILDEVSETKGKIANNLGFPNIGTLDRYLESNTSAKDGMTLVRACKNYKSIVNLYDKEYA